METRAAAARTFKQSTDVGIQRIYAVGIQAGQNSLCVCRSVREELLHTLNLGAIFGAKTWISVLSVMSLQDALRANPSISRIVL